MKFVKERWDFLDFIDNQKPLVVLMSFAKEAEARSKICIDFRLQQIDDGCFRKRMTNPITFPHLSWAPKKCRFPRRERALFTIDLMPLFYPDKHAVSSINETFSLLPPKNGGQYVRH